MQKLLVLVILAVVSFTLLWLRPTQQDPKQQIVGRWKENLTGAIMEFSDDGQYTVTASDASYSGTGIYRFVDTNEIEIIEKTEGRGTKFSINFNGDTLMMGEYQKFTRVE